MMSRARSRSRVETGNTGFQRFQTGASARRDNCGNKLFCKECAVVHSSNCRSGRSPGAAFFFRHQDPAAWFAHLTIVLRLEIQRRDSGTIRYEVDQFERKCYRLLRTRPTRSPGYGLTRVSGVENQSSKLIDVRVARFAFKIKIAAGLPQWREPGEKPCFGLIQELALAQVGRNVQFLLEYRGGRNRDGLLHG
jgi:hypothetical protein